MDYQNTRVIGLNSNEQTEKQAKWVDEVLSNTSQKWKVVTFHHPLFSASEGRDNEELRNLWKPIFDKHEVDLVLQGHDHSYARGRVSPGDNVLDGVNLRDKTGTVYVVSVSGGKMYKLRPNAWDGWEADRDRAAENTQLFQVISIEDDKLSFESYTAIGELYDAFDLVKKPNEPNSFVERKDQGIKARRFDNTIPYQDTLPENLKEIIFKQYKGHQLNRVSFVREDGVTGYRVRIRNDKQSVYLFIDQSGKILNEDIYTF